MSDLRCEARGSQGIFEFVCPFCGRLVLVATEPWRALALQATGAARMTGPVPFELLEPHQGPPVIWDEVLDAHLALGQDDLPQAELVPATNLVAAARPARRLIGGPDR
ncbi:MAG: hypothetical protein ABR592_01475 [Nitriliruptorales bacterium]